MGAYSLLYLAFGMVLLFYTDGILKLINFITGELGAGPALGFPADPLWGVITVSLLLLLSLMCLVAYLDIRRNRNLVWLMVFAKLASSACQLGYYAFSRNHPPGFVVGALVDGFLGLLALVFLLRSRVGSG